jgi:hypothetical protein
MPFYLCPEDLQMFVNNKHDQNVGYAAEKPADNIDSATAEEK